jgi:hypothetical protein
VHALYFPFLFLGLIREISIYAQALYALTFWEISDIMSFFARENIPMAFPENIAIDDTLIDFQSSNRKTASVVYFASLGETCCHYPRIVFKRLP